MRVSVIIPVYNPSPEFFDCLTALARSTHAPFEVIIVDDCSTPPVDLSSTPLTVTLIRADESLGPGGARNLAATKAHGELLLFIDADVVIERDTIQKIVVRFEGDAHIAALSGLYTYRSNYDNLSSVYHNLYIEYKQHHVPEDGPYADTAILGVRKEIFDAAGGFRTAMFTGEDLEFGYRLYSEGYKVCCDPRVRVSHHKFLSFKGWIKNRFCHCTNMIMAKLEQMRTAKQRIASNRVIFTILPMQIASAFLLAGALLAIIAYLLFRKTGIASIEVSIVILYAAINARYMSFIFARMGTRGLLLLPYIILEHCISLCSVLATGIRWALRLPSITYRGG